MGGRAGGPAGTGVWTSKPWRHLLPPKSLRRQPLRVLGQAPGLAAAVHALAHLLAVCGDALVDHGGRSGDEVKVILPLQPLLRSAGRAEQRAGAGSGSVFEWFQPRAEPEAEPEAEHGAESGAGRGSFLRAPAWPCHARLPLGFHGQGPSCACSHTSPAPPAPAPPPPAQSPCAAAPGSRSGSQSPWRSTPARAAWHGRGRGHASPPRLLCSKAAPSSLQCTGGRNSTPAPLPLSVSSPRLPQAPPLHPAWRPTSGSKASAASFSCSFCSASRRSAYWSASEAARHSAQRAE